MTEGRSAPALVVLGAGPAGLAAAWRAALGGHRVVVLERGDAPGGLAASFEVGGMRVDHGSHRLHPSAAPAILAVLQDLLGGTLQWRPRRGRIRLEGRWVGFPLRAGDLARHLSPRFALGATADTLTAALRRPRADTFAEVVRAGLGPTVLDRFYGPFARKLWGLGPEELSGALARVRIGRSTPAALLSAFGAGRGRPSSGFWYPAGGFGAITDALAAAAVAAGVDLRCGAEVVGLELGGRQKRAVLSSGEGVEAAAVWSTLPLPVLARLARPAPPSDVLLAAGRLRFRALVLVYLVLRTRRWTPFDAHYLPGPETPVSRVSEPRNYRDSPEDPADRTVLCVEVPCSVGDATWGSDDGELAARVAVDLEAAGLPAVRPTAWELKRVPAVYPVYASGVEDDRGAVERWAASLHDVVPLGRGGLFTHDNIHHALAMAWAAADALAPDGTWDAGAWEAARARFGAHVVED